MYAHSRAPVRVGIAGGGTDLPAWTRERVGRCLSLAIRRHTHAVAISRSDGQVVASYRKRDCDRAATEIANGLIRESALLHGWETGFEVHTLSELSSRGSGLGVSSSFAVALAACFREFARLRGPSAHWQDLRYRAMEGRPVSMSVKDGSFAVEDDPSYPASIARDAWTVEIDRLRRPIGRQDHMAAAHGGLRLYGFAADGAEVERTFSREDAEWVAAHLVLVELPRGHDSREILSSVADIGALEQASAAVPHAICAIEERNPQLLGQALLLGQASKRAIRGASPAWLEEILERVAAVRGVYGCKVAGAGGGGHLVVACKSGSSAAIEAATQLATIAVEPDHEGVRSEGWA